MEQKLTFKNSRGDNLVGIISGPDEKPRPIVIMCHGSTTSKNSQSLVDLSKILNEKGITTFRPDFYGHGESEGKFEDITVSEIIDDVNQAINCLKSKGCSKIGLLGSSFGASAVLLVASQHPEIFVLALKSPVVDPKDFDNQKRSQEEMTSWKQTGFTIYDPFDPKKTKVKYLFFEDYQKYDGYKTAEQIKVPTIIVHGSADPEVSPKDSIKAAKLFPSCELHLIEGADHRYSNPAHYEEMLRVLSDFIVKQAFKSAPENI